MRTALLLAVFSCFSLIEGKPFEDETCVGIRREDSSYDFDLPDAVAVNLQDLTCDAEWTIDNYVNHLTCSCTNSTNIYPVFSTTLPSRDSSSTAIKTNSSVRQHYAAIAVAAIFVITLVILAFHSASTAKYAPEEQNQPGSVE